MDLLVVLKGALYVGIASLIIMYLCNSLEQGLDFLGRNMSAGAKGALLLAVASSLPEIMVSLAFVFSGEPELILAGAFVTAGSALFNICLIPALSIIYAGDKNGNPVKEFELDRKVLYRDTFWLLTIEALFIYFFGMNVFTIGMAVALTLVYFLYAAHVLFDSHKNNEGCEDYEYEEIDHTETPKVISWIGKVLDFNKILFSNKEFTTKSALIVSLLAGVGVGVACHFLAEGTVMMSDGLGIPVMIGAAVFAAGATSLPDTLLSVSAAKNGDYEDAVGNAVGSNIFDTSFAIGVPMVIALIGGGVLIGQDLSGGLTIEHGDGFMDTVRYFVWGTSAVAGLSLITMSRKITRNTAYILLSLYSVWLGYLIYSVV